MVHKFEKSLIHEREQSKKADNFYNKVLLASEIRRFNTDSDSDLLIQKEDVDLILTLNNVNYRVSEKFRDKDYGDLYIEIFSKYPKTEGWLHTGSPHAILYFTPTKVYWISHKSLSDFCFQRLFPLISLVWYEEIYQSGKSIMSKKLFFEGNWIKINLIQAHNQTHKGQHWETIGISVSFTVLKNNGVKIKEFAIE